jgi:hypothetical protein
MKAFAKAWPKGMRCSSLLHSRHGAITWLCLTGSRIVLCGSGTCALRRIRLEPQCDGSADQEQIAQAERPGPDQLQQTLPALDSDFRPRFSRTLPLRFPDGFGTGSRAGDRAGHASPAPRSTPGTWTGFSFIGSQFPLEVDGRTFIWTSSFTTFASTATSSSSWRPVSLSPNMPGS